MEPFIWDDNDELLEEALVILDSVDVDRLGTATSQSLIPAQEIPDQQAAENDLPHNGKQPKSSVGSSSTVTSQRHNLEEKKASLNGQHYDNQVESGRPARASLYVQAATVSAEKTSPRSTRSGGGRTRMREQLIQLRSVVQKMENHLETLRSPRPPRFDIHAKYVEDREAMRNLVGDENESRRANIPEPTGEISDEAAVWRNIAMQQFRARRKAEHENIELRERLTAQIQLSKQVENLLQAQPPHPNLLVAEPPPPLKIEDDTKQHQSATTKDSLD